MSQTEEKKPTANNVQKKKRGKRRRSKTGKNVNLQTKNAA
jgi:hypothetical protein